MPFIWLTLTNDSSMSPSGSLQPNNWQTYDFYLFIQKTGKGCLWGVGNFDKKCVINCTESIPTKCSEGIKNHGGSIDYWSSKYYRSIYLTGMKRIFLILWNVLFFLPRILFSWPKTIVIPSRPNVLYNTLNRFLFFIYSSIYRSIYYSTMKFVWHYHQHYGHLLSLSVYVFIFFFNKKVIWLIHALILVVL